MNSSTQMPTLTNEHLHQAFEAMHWPGWTFEAAMANDMRRRLIVCRAHHLRTREWLDNTAQTKKNVRRVVLDAKGDVARWCTQVVMGPRVDTPQLDLPIKPI